MNALYVDFISDDIISPKEIISHKDSESIIHTLRVAIDRIITVEHEQGRIGTKGFMK